MRDLVEAIEEGAGGGRRYPVTSVTLSWGEVRLGQQVRGGRAYFRYLLSSTQ